MYISNPVFFDLSLVNFDALWLLRRACVCITLAGARLVIVSHKGQAGDGRVQLVRDEWSGLGGRGADCIIVGFKVSSHLRFHPSRGAESRFRSYEKWIFAVLFYVLFLCLFFAVFFISVSCMIYTFCVCLKSMWPELVLHGRFPF